MFLLSLRVKQENIDILESAYITRAIETENKRKLIEETSGKRNLKYVKFREKSCFNEAAFGLFIVSEHIPLFSDETSGFR